MERIITIGNKECKFKTSAALPRMYRLKFRRDIFNDLDFVQKKMQKKNENDSIPVEALTTFENIAYLMHKHGDPTQPNDINHWLEQFDTFNIYQIFPLIIEMWAQENETIVEAKKKIDK